MSDDRHEVGVTTPAWDDVLMQMSGDARARDGAKVHAHVEALRSADPPQDPDGVLGQFGKVITVG